MNAYIDTSILGAYYCPEAGSQAAEKALLKYNTPTISALTEVEFLSLLGKKVRCGDLNRRNAREIQELFSFHVAEGFYRRIALSTEHYIAAKNLLTDSAIKLHTLDALHLAVAMHEGLPILTSDQVLAGAAKKHKHKSLIIK